MTNNEEPIPNISVRTRKLLWGRSGSRCAMCDNKSRLIEEIGDTTDQSIVGDEAHIVAKSEDGPRGEDSLPIAKRNEYPNLILLCKKHHKIIDDNPSSYTIAYLKRIKTEHEQWVENTLGFDDKLEKDLLIYLKYIEKWEQLFNIDGWKNLIQFIVGQDRLQMKFDQFDDWLEGMKYLKSRVWPRRFIFLEDSLMEFASIVNDFLIVFIKHREVEHHGLFRSKQLHKQNWQKDHSVYERLAREDTFHNEFGIDLLFELTRSGNRVIDAVRKDISHFYRINEGRLQVEIGTPFLGTKIFNTEYLDTQTSKQQYNGLEAFMTERNSRDIVYGSGVADENYYRT